MTAPTIETERLILRRPGARDEDGYVAFVMSDRASHIGKADTEFMAWALFAAEIGHWALRGWGMFAVTLRGDDTCVGMVGPFFPRSWVEREIGWLIWPEAEGRGIAREAAAAARAHAYRVLGWPGAVSYIAPENARSIRLAERLGARRDAAARHPFGDAPCLVYRHPAPEALQ